MNELEFKSNSERVLGYALRHHAEHTPDVVFIHFNDEKYTYKEANSIVNSYAAGFKKLGVKKGDVVSLFLTTSPEIVFITLAINKLGAIWSPVCTDYRKDWLIQDLENSCAKILVTESSLLPKIVELGEELPNDILVLLDEYDPGTVFPKKVQKVAKISEWRGLPDEEPDQSDFDYGDTCAITWTSGTTGKPKGVMICHNHFFVCAEVTYWLRKGDVVYCCFPTYNIGAWSALIMPTLVLGLTLALEKRFSVERFWDRVRHYNVTYTMMLGAMTMFLWNAPEKPDDAENSLRALTCIPIPEDIKEEFRIRFGLESINMGYGQSEISNVVMRVEDGTRTWPRNSCGVAYPWLEIKLVDDDDNEVPIGTPGEFAVRSSEPYRMFKGYFNNPEANEHAFRNGWYHTGDLAIRDQEGNFFFYDRKKDFIRFKGRSVSSFQVESVITKHPGVAECAAYGIPSKHLSSEAEIMVMVVLKPGVIITGEELARFINEHAPYYIVPRYIEFADKLPKTPTLKVRKVELRDRGVTAATWDREAVSFKVAR